jgi:hypothetical protein
MAKRWPSLLVAGVLPLVVMLAWSSAPPPFLRPAAAPTSPTRLATAASAPSPAPPSLATSTEVVPAATTAPTLTLPAATSPTPAPSPTPIPTPSASATARPTVVAPPLPHVTGAPIALRVPRIGVVATVEPVGIERDGTMAAPSGPFTVGWWDGGYLPGQSGNAVLDGHVDYRGVGPAVFWRLGELHPGDPVLVDMPGGRVLRFVVERQATYPYNAAPLAQIFGPSDVPRLNLITCTGDFNPVTRNYNRRLVVYAKLVG